MIRPVGRCFQIGQSGLCFKFTFVIVISNAMLNPNRRFGRQEL